MTKPFRVRGCGVAVWTGDAEPCVHAADGSDAAAGGLGRLRGTAGTRTNRVRSSQGLLPMLLLIKDANGKAWDLTDVLGPDCMTVTDTALLTLAKATVWLRPGRRHPRQAFLPHRVKEMRR